MALYSAYKFQIHIRNALVLVVKWLPDEIDKAKNQPAGETF